ncbi:MAG TPA: HWE histidine kinase domain-containing protein [Rhizomicrobium sp.]|nr:HWE histidine kinase domain-containing protein [Rhizomicrobium sp.]
MSSASAIAEPLIPPPPHQLPAAMPNLEQTLLDALPIGVCACDAQGLILRVNRKATELWGRAPRLLDSAQLFCGSFRLESLDGYFIPPDRTPMARTVLHGEATKGAEAIVINPDGKRWVARCDVASLKDAQGHLLGAINCFQDITQEHEMRQALTRQSRTFDLAMVASRMGTWRYTIADNICVYDENAQALYGLSEARFLHDEEGVKAKFHPGDMDLMWSRVKKALDPKGDGRYEVEYRVKQGDGSWRWLSAWGLVEFEGEGAARKPVAIAGASRDLSELKKAGEMQRLLINELNHRVKNTLATVQAITAQTLRSASDLASAREALDRRIIAMAHAHDLLTAKSWVSADLGEIVARALDAFSQARVTIAGEPVELPPKHALALSLTLHELATNATKYGALSGARGHVRVAWKNDKGVLRLDWEESDGPAVAEPRQKGFGSRLLQILIRDLDGTARLEFPASGVCCTITAALPTSPN